MWKVGTLLSIAAYSVAPCHGFFPSFSSTEKVNTMALKEDTSFTAPNTEEILEQACVDTANRMNRILVPVSKDVCESEEVGISYVHWKAEGGSNNKEKPLPIVLVHGFDSSCLEYRRLGSKLAAQGIDTYAVDILGWGFTKLGEEINFSAQSKVEALNNFVEQILGPDEDFCVGGASLGGAAAIELAAASSNQNCKGLILIDAQGFVDGVGPMAALPKPLAWLGVQVLKSEPLRSSANQMSYFDKENFATEDALNIGRLHCVQNEGWSDAMISFMKSGGFTPSAKVPTIQAPALILWGRDDGILDGEEFANKFLETLPNAQLRWIEECGHVPHLEQPEETATLIADFLKSTVSDISEQSSSPVLSLENLFQR